MYIWTQMPMCVCVCMLLAPQCKSICPGKSAPKGNKKIYLDPAGNGPLCLGPWAWKG